MYITLKCLWNIKVELSDLKSNIFFYPEAKSKFNPTDTLWTKKINQLYGKTFMVNGSDRRRWESIRILRQRHH